MVGGAGDPQSHHASEPPPGHDTRACVAFRPASNRRPVPGWTTRCDCQTAGRYARTSSSLPDALRCSLTGASGTDAQSTARRRLPTATTGSPSSRRTESATSERPQPSKRAAGLFSASGSTMSQTSPFVRSSRRSQVALLAVSEPATRVRTPATRSPRPRDAA